ncbi:GSCFA domain-containing protein [Cesiribacter sp. SM1]|uniref:GSCFA domain-containing protein n=1 Tax=Cesiribacter sp. SM1 TaxID=2861196 RepID=UPI001CD4FAF1|nr:GSCFA domain-containing protein [Cesiribacter sp. SM1]
MEFRTELQPGASPFKLGLQKPILSVGSCFAAVIGERLQESKFRVLVNPFGTLFHPLPLVQLLQMAVEDRQPSETTYLLYQERWLNYLLHSSLNAPSREVLQQQLKSLFREVKHYLQQGQALVLTLGTSFVYELAEADLTVANCHKQPQRLFNKRLVPAEESLQALEQLWQQLKEFNPSLRLVLTVSPVRHLKDTLELNSVSKAMLRVVCHQLQEKYPQEVYYFPSYELLMDDLRDYRFYNPDLLHPTPAAEQYVWEKFTATLLDEEARAFLKEWEPLKQSLRHRPFNPTSLAHRQFLQKTLQKLQALSGRVDVGNEIKKLQEQLQP